MVREGGFYVKTPDLYDRVEWGGGGDLLYTSKNYVKN